MTNLITIIAKFALTLTWSFIQTNLDSEILMAINQTIEISGLDMITEMLNGFDFAEMLMNGENGSLVIFLLFVSLSPLFFFFLVLVLNRTNKESETILESVIMNSNETTKLSTQSKYSVLTCFPTISMELNSTNRFHNANLR